MTVSLIERKLAPSADDAGLAARVHQLLDFAEAKFLKKEFTKDRITRTGDRIRFFDKIGFLEVEKSVSGGKASWRLQSSLDEEKLTGENSAQRLMFLAMEEVFLNRRSEKALKALVVDVAPNTNTKTSELENHYAIHGKEGELHCIGVHENEEYRCFLKLKE